MKRVVMILAMVSVLAIPMNSYGEEFARETNMGAMEYEVSINDIETMRKMTFNEALSRRVKQDKISYEKAYSIMKDEENAILKDLAVDIYKKGGNTKNTLQKENAINEILDALKAQRVVNYYDYEKNQSYSGNSRYKAAVCATIIIVDDYSNKKVISGVSGSVWSRPTAGMYEYDWVEGTTSNQVSADKKTITLRASGYFTTETDASISISGFYATGTVGGTFKYSSNTMSIAGSHKVY